MIGRNFRRGAVAGLILFAAPMFGAAQQVGYRSAVRNDGWTLPQVVAKCPVESSSDVVLQGQALRETVLDKKCFEWTRVTEPLYDARGNTLYITNIEYLIERAVRYEMGGKTVMVEAQLSIYDKTGRTGAVFTYYYVPTNPDGIFDLRVENFRPRLPKWARRR